MRGLGLAMSLATPCTTVWYSRACIDAIILGSTHMCKVNKGAQPPLCYPLKGCLSVAKALMKRCLLSSQLSSYIIHTHITQVDIAKCTCNNEAPHAAIHLMADMCITAAWRLLY